MIHEAVKHSAGEYSAKATAFKYKCCVFCIHMFVQAVRRMISPLRAM
jgi:hypothetical protein